MHKSRYYKSPRERLDVALAPSGDAQRRAAGRAATWCAAARDVNPCVCRASACGHNAGAISALRQRPVAWVAPVFISIVEAVVVCIRG